MISCCELLRSLDETRSRHRTTTAEEINDVERTNTIGAVSMGFLFVLRFLLGLLAKTDRNLGPRKKTIRLYFLITILCILL